MDFAAVPGIHAFFPATPRPRIKRAEGVWFEDTEGRRYMDASSGPVVSNLGHGNRRVLDAMRDQAEAVAFAFPMQWESEANLLLSARLAALAGPGLERAFLVSGGSEAVETALKFARQHAVASGQASRWKVIGRDPGYHGGTMGALAVTGDKAAHAMFGPMMRSMPLAPAPFSYRVPANHTPATYAQACADALDALIRTEGPDTVLAFIMEPVGGLATGALVAPDAYYAAVREICTRHGVLLIFDEVMSGAGRTGHFLAAGHWPQVQPDLVVLAKGVTAGYTPMGAVLAVELVADKAEKRMIPLERMAPYRMQALGLEHGLALYCRRTGGGAYGDWLMITPPLIVTEAEVDELAERLAATLEAYVAELRRDGVI
jgi:adenosylmethionine-8-amino-7-oxononanoate aminotransferase